MSNMDSVHERIRELRIQLHLSQEYVAKYLGIDRVAYEQIEKGNCILSADDVNRLNILFGVSIFKAPFDERNNCL